MFGTLKKLKGKNVSICKLVLEPGDSNILVFREKTIAIGKLTGISQTKITIENSGLAEKHHIPITEISCIHEHDDLDIPTAIIIK